MTMLTRHSFLAGLAATAVSGCRTRGGAETLRVAHVCDPQFGFRSAGETEEAYKADWARTRRMFADIRAAAPDCVALTGDLTHKVGAFRRDWPALRAEIDLPLAAAPGNHDIREPLKRKDVDDWRAVFGPDYGSFDVRGWRVLWDNTQYYRFTDETAAVTAERKWLEGALADLKASGRPGVFVTHIPPFVKDADEPDNWENIGSFARKGLLEALDGAGVKFWFAGHLHRTAERKWRGMTILNGETTSWNFDGRPHGWRWTELRTDGTYDWMFRPSA